MSETPTKAYEQLFLQALCDELAAEQAEARGDARSADIVALARGRQHVSMTHWKGCEAAHVGCLLARLADEIERLEAEVARLRAEAKGGTR